MPWHERSSSEKRRGPSERSWTSSAVHFAPMISAVAATAQVPATWTGFIVRTAIPRLYARPAEGRYLLGSGIRLEPLGFGEAPADPAREPGEDERDRSDD